MTMCLNLSSLKRTAVLLAAVAAVAAGTAHAALPAMTGTWKISGDVQGVPVSLTCVMLEADHKLSGVCTDGSDGKTHDILGTVTDATVSFHFSSAYQGTPITVGLQGTVEAPGTKMSGNIAVPEFNADGDFTATRQPSPAN